MKNGKKREVEIKLEVASAAAARGTMRKLGARDLGRVHEMNTIYDTPQDTLRKRGQLLRVRVATTKGGKKWGVLTRKGPSLRSVQPAGRQIRRPQSGLTVPRELYKEREEREVMLAGSRIAAQGRKLRAAGFGPVFRYEKHRTSYRLPAKVAWARRLVIELDETPAGTYWELEGPRRAIDRAARLLGYSRTDYITKSYVALWSEFCRRQGMRRGDMLFRRLRRRQRGRKK